MTANGQTHTHGRGTKQNPLCTHCGLKGHYATTCPKLALTALAALTKTTPARSLADHLRAGKPLKVWNVAMKGRRTLKRASGKRGFVQPHKVDKGLKQKKSMLQNRANERRRKPRPMKTKLGTAGLTAQGARSAYRNLLASGWVWKPGCCECGNSFEKVPWKTCLQRGRGRLFLRCYECESPLPKHLMQFMLSWVFHGHKAE